ncbi:MAG: hypothetical protein MUP58_01585 [Candidatus Nanohaloarchaeota archaeon QJJ-9]|nr:hypothetical protein [Candidatus Nanohaloarchaeota archaeon QJJ-9]
MGLIGKAFSDEEWREHLDEEVARKIEKILNRIKPFKEAYKKSRHESVAQLWVALAEIYRDVERIDRRLDRIERYFEKDKEERDEELEDLAGSLENY